MSDKTTDQSLQSKSEPGDSDRRTFLRNAALVTGAATVSGLTANSASAAPLAEATAVSCRKMVSASFDPKYELDIWSLQDVIGQILRESGCTTCGLVGLDIRLGLDPLIQVESKIPVNVTMQI